MKFVGTVAFIVAVSLLPVGAFAIIGVAWLATLAVGGLAHVGALHAARRAFFAAPFMLAALPLVYTRTGDPLGSFALGPLTLTVSGEGLEQFATIAAKSWVSVQAALLLAFTTPFHELVDGLRKLRLPQVMVAIIGFMYRYLGVLGDEAGRMNRARAARSADPDGRGGGRILWRARVTGAMVGSLFLRSYARSERIYAAMQARGFEGEFRHLHTRAVRPAEYAALAALLAVATLIVVASHTWLAP